MSRVQVSKVLAAAALATVAMSVAAPAPADDVLATLWPVEAGSYALGATHLLATFVAADGNCAVTAVIEERVADEPSASPARVRFDLAPGGRAVVENAGGEGVALVCGDNAELLRVEGIGAGAVVAAR